MQTAAAASESNNITSIDNCPTWFVPSNNSPSAGGGCPHCVCRIRKSITDLVMCDQVQQQSYLEFGYCMTYNSNCSDKSDPDAISFSSCPYVYYSNIVDHRYLALPRNVSDLNDVFCAPLNRDGLLCRDCIDGFGPSVATFGYACAICSEISYGWMLYILVEFVPATIFYFAVLTLRIRITSAPMNCFVMFGQLVVIVLNQDPGFHGALMSELDKTSLAVFKVILTCYGFWNLDFFRSVIPPFCVSQGLKNMHVLALQYVSAFYPLLLIALTYACVELHGHNFRPLVWLWKPFHRCCVNVRRRWDSKASLIDVFATFLLLSYSKLMIVSLYLLQAARIFNADGEPALGTSDVLHVDATVRFLSEEHLPFAIIAFLILVFTFLPPLLLIFYPCKVFNRCLNHCSKRRWLVLRTFVEAFQECYRDGVTGGWDFRSMSGVYLLLRLILFLANYHVPLQIGWLLRALMLLGSSMFILIVQPYKKNYMNVLDGLLLGLLGFMTLLLITFKYLLPSATNETLPLIIVITCALPQLALLLSITYRHLKGKWLVKYVAGRVGALLKCMHIGKQTEDAQEDPLPHRLVSPDQYNRSLLSVSEQADTNVASAVQGPIPPVYTYGSIN